VVSPPAAVSSSPSPVVALPDTDAAAAAACSIENGDDCEACQ
jgi:ribonucleoside-diphosphate reductase alpha chain